MKLKKVRAILTVLILTISLLFLILSFQPNPRFSQSVVFPTLIFDAGMPPP